MLPDAVGLGMDEFSAQYPFSYAQEAFERQQESLGSIVRVEHGVSNNRTRGESQVVGCQVAYMCGQSKFSKVAEGPRKAGRKETTLKPANPPTSAAAHLIKECGVSEDTRRNYSDWSDEDLYKIATHCKDGDSTQAEAWWQMKQGVITSTNRTALVTFAKTHMPKDALPWEAWTVAELTRKVPYLTIPYHTIPYHTIPYHTIPYRTVPHHTIPYHTISYHTIPYHTIPYHTIPYHTIRYHTIPYNAIPYHTIPYNTIPYHTIPYHTIPYHTIPYHTIPYHTIPYQTLP